MQSSTRSTTQVSSPALHISPAGTFYPSFPPLLCSAETGDIAWMDECLAQGMDPNEQDYFGATALMYAATMGQNDIVHELLEAKADPSLRDNAGRTCLFLASREGMIGAVDEIILE